MIVEYEAFKGKAGGQGRLSDTHGNWRFREIGSMMSANCCLSALVLYIFMSSSNYQVLASVASITAAKIKLRLPRSGVRMRLGLCSDCICAVTVNRRHQPSFHFRFNSMR
jgi:hypothetical protein